MQRGIEPDRVRQLEAIQPCPAASSTGHRVEAPGATSQPSGASGSLGQGRRAETMLL